MADRLFGITDAGKVRDNNEDVFIAQEVMNGQFIIAGVIDGVGGYEGGEVAAALTRQVILDELEVIGTDVTAQLILAFNLANEEILARKLEDQQLSGMACVATVAVVDLQNNLLYYIHVGDTRLYLFRDNSLVKISRDQSFVGFLEDSGRLSEDAAMQHPNRNQINQALGLTTADEITDAYFETGTSPFLPGDLILICSDGLTDMVDKALLAEVLTAPGSLAQKAERLVAEANAAGGKDNITVVLVKNDKAPVQHDISRPADLFTQEPPKSQVKTITIEVPVPTIAPLPLAEPAVPAQQSPAALAETRASSSKPYSYWIGGLSLVCLLLLASTLWLWFKSPSPVPRASQITASPKPSLSAGEKLLQDTLLKLKGDTLRINADTFKGKIMLSKALQINRDTLIIQTKGDLLIQSDSAFKGPALILSSTSKYVSINNLIFQDFETALVSYKNALDLKNVRFNHCKYPLQVLFEFPDHFYVNGRMTKRPYLTDSLARK